jgi:hypothetical protein
LQLHEVHDVDHADFEVGQMLAHDRDGGERLQRGHVAATGHHHVGRNALIEHRQYIEKYGEDLPEVRHWTWAQPRRTNRRNCRIRFAAHEQ